MEAREQDRRRNRERRQTLPGPQHNSPPPERQRLRRALRVAAWNALLLFAAAALTALAAETYLRLAPPFWGSEQHFVFVPRVGFLWEPNTEYRSTNRFDYWTVSRANSLGFLDREPPSPERAAANCLAAVIGDSFVEAWQVPIAQKFHVRLERLAADALPHLDIATAAFGMGRTGQIQQLAFYDEFARHLRPKLLVLVFVPNDFAENAPLTQALTFGWDPQHLPLPSAARLADGTIELRPPHADAWEFRLPRLPARPPWGGRALVRAIESSRFALWLKNKTNLLSTRALRGLPSISEQQNAWAEELRRRPAYAALFTGWQPPMGPYSFEASNLPPLYEDALDYTLFALEQFKQRADRDGAKLVILASHSLKVSGRTRIFERMNAMAAALDIPVIDQADYILRQGAALEDAHWRHDLHWNADGHRWAAEALLEWLRDNQEVCAPSQRSSARQRNTSR